MTREQIRSYPAAPVSTIVDTVTVCWWLREIAAQQARTNELLEKLANPFSPECPPKRDFLTFSEVSELMDILEFNHGRSYVEQCRELITRFKLARTTLEELRHPITKELRDAE